MKNELGDTRLPRYAYFSRVHEEGEVFPCLLQAIDIAYQGVTGSSAAKLPRLEPGDSLAHRLAFVVGETSFDWCKIRAGVTAHISEGTLPRQDVQYFYILDKLGEGGIATVYLACTSSGHVCAIKDFHLRPPPAASAQEREAEENKKRNSLYASVKNEEGRWKEIYAGRFQARIKYLGGKPCLLMPYGHEIADEPGDRWKFLPAIRDELIRFATPSRKRPGYMYKESDLRWRHVLLDAKKDIFLCDLESLKEIEDVMDENESKAASENAVYEQVNILLKPMRHEEAEQITLQWIGSNTNDVVSFICDVEPLHTFLKDFVRGTHNDTDETEKFRGLLVSFFSAAATLGDLSEAKARATLSLISHYRSFREQGAISDSQSDTSVPGLSRLLSADEDNLGKRENVEAINESKKRGKTAA